MLIRHRGIAPTIDPTAYVAPTATLVGDVRIGPRVRVMFGAVLDSEASYVEVGEATVISENAVLRATAVAAEPHPVVLGDHIFVGPHTTLLGCHIERCCYLAAQATVLQGAHLGAGSVIAVGALAHAGTVLDPETFVAPMSVAIGSPAKIFSSADPDRLGAAIRGVNFAATAFGVDHEWSDRIARYETMTEVRVAEYAAHLDDEPIG